MPKINTEDRGVFETEMSVQAVRDLSDGKDLPDDVSGILDEAQGYVFSGEGDEAVVVLRITK